MAYWYKKNINNELSFLRRQESIINSISNLKIPSFAGMEINLTHYPNQ